MIRYPRNSDVIPISQGLATEAGRSMLPLVLGGVSVLLATGHSLAGETTTPAPFVMTASDVADTNAQPFQITQEDVEAAAVAGRTLTYQGTESAGNAAITNNEGDRVDFTQQSTAAQATIVNNSGGSAQFSDQSSAGSAFLTNNADSQLGFSDRSTAAGSNITNNEGGMISFSDQSSASTAAITNNGTVIFDGQGNAQQANITNNGGATVSFTGRSRADDAQLTNNGTIGFEDHASAGASLVTNNASGVVGFSGTSSAGSSAITNNGSVSFADTATAASSSMINNRTGSIGFTGNSTAGSAFIANSGEVAFKDQSSAGSAEIVNNATGTLLVSGSASLGTATLNNGGRALFSGNGSAGSASILTRPDGVTLFTQESEGGLASLQADRGGVVDVSGVTDGAISVGSIAGPGTYYLGGVTLTLGADGGFATVDGTITDGGAYGGTGGGLVKVGAGTLTLSGTNSYTGDTIVRAGVLQAGAAGSFAHVSDFAVEAGALLDLAGFDQQIGALSGDGDIDLATGTLTLDQDGDSAFRGTIDGTGGLVKTGDGALELSGTSGYSGAMTVEAGELQVSGSIAQSAVTVEQGAILSGNGTVGTTIVEGTLSRQDDGGTMTVSGDLTFASGSIYAVAVDASPTATLLNVTGTATLDGTLAVTPVGLFTPGGTTIRILSASDVDGTFASVYTTMPFIDLSVIYGASDVDLDITRNGRDFAESAETPNQAAVAQALDGLGTGSVYTAVVNSPSDEAARMAFDSLSGEIYASIPTAVIENDYRLQSMLRDRAAKRLRLNDTEPAFWARPYFTDARYGTNGNAATASGSGAGILAGFDGAIGVGSYMGVGAGYGRDDLDVSGRGSTADISTLSVSGYWALQVGGWRATMGALASWHAIDADRLIAFKGFEDRTRSSYHAASGQVYGELGYPMTAGALEWTPFVNLAYAYWRGDAFNENGGEAALAVGKSGADGIIGTAGIRLGGDFTLDETTNLHLGGLIGWRFASLHDDGNRMRLAGGDPFYIGGVPLQRDAAVLALDAGVTRGRSSLGLGYQGLYGGNSRSQTLRATFELRF